MTMNSIDQTGSANQFNRVRNHTSDRVNAQIDETIAQVQKYADESDEAIAQRLQELEREWDTERVLEANALCRFRSLCKQ